VEELLRLGELAGQRIGRSALALPSEGGRTDPCVAIHSGSPSSDKGVGEDGVETRCVECGVGWQRRRQ
jgi:hypothetical protein